MFRLRPHLWLLAAALALALWAPAEIHPLSRLALSLVAAVLAAALLAEARRAPVTEPAPGVEGSAGGASWSAAAVVCGLAASSALSLHPYASLHLLASLAGSCAFYLACRRWAAPARWQWLAWFVAVSAGVAAWGCLQAAGGMERTLQMAQAEAGDLPPVWRARLESGRAFGTLLLPAALGGLMAMAVPVAAGLAAGTRGARRMAAGLAAGVCLLALASSRSYGALAGAAAAAVWAAGRLPRRPRLALRAGMLGVLALSVAIFAWVRHQQTGQHLLGREGPLVQRLLNWETASRVALRYPLLGCGPGAYASAFVSARQEGENDTRFAHSTPLQAAAEAGVWALLPLGVAAAAVFRRLRRAREGAPEAFGAAAGLVSFAAHNLIDFTAYLPATLWAALALAAVLPEAAPPGPGCGSAPPAPHPASSAAGARWVRRLLLGGLTAACVAAVLPAHRQWKGEGLREQARQAARAGAPAASAAEAYGAAVEADPGRADLRLERAAFLLRAGESRPREALQEARAAARADRGSALAHFLASVAWAEQQEWAEAYLEALTATAIHPRAGPPREWLGRLERQVGPALRPAPKSGSPVR